MSEYNIKYFDPRMIKPGSVILILGRRGSGKSTVAEDLLSFHRECSRGLCVSATERSNNFWSSHIPQCFIHYTYSDSLTRQLFRQQQKIKKETGEIPPVFAIFDDLLFDKSFARSKETRKLLMNGRHSKIFTIISAQYLMDLGPDLRANIDFVFVLRENIKSNREKIYQYFAGVFPDYQSFEDVLVACTEDNEALVLDQNSLSYNISDCVFFYKATPNLRYRLCDKRYWEFSEGHRKPESDSSDNEKSHQQRTVVRKKYPR